MTTACSEKVLQTWATAMDIQVPYNVERIVLMAAGLDTARVAALMKQFEADTAVKLPEDLRAAVRGVVVDSVMVASGEMVETMLPKPVKVSLPSCVPGERTQKIALRPELLQDMLARPKRHDRHAEERDRKLQAVLETDKNMLNTFLGEVVVGGGRTGDVTATTLPLPREVLLPTCVPGSHTIASLSPGDGMVPPTEGQREHWELEEKRLKQMLASDKKLLDQTWGQVVVGGGRTPGYTRPLLPLLRPLPDPLDSTPSLTLGDFPFFEAFALTCSS